MWILIGSEAFEFTVAEVSASRPFREADLGDVAPMTIHPSGAGSAARTSAGSTTNETRRHAPNRIGWGN
jgi:hypothetical protein